MKHFSKLLVANRGEIACRVIRGARSMGLNTVAVYSDADADALHVELADESVHIGPALAAESYLAIPKILDAAKRTGADAIHPGYGFLSENPEFSKACEEAGIVFVGPSADAINQMGNKAQAKHIAIDAGVRCIRGYQGKDQSDEAFLTQARDIGFPLLIKAAAGGGGRGMRRVASETDLPAALSGARTESKNAFGSEELILEELVEHARHVEIQIIADSHGNCVSLGERDCSVQRRHQKIIEESPCPVMTEAIRKAMSEAAKKVAQAVGYVNAGTVEFLLDDEGTFYFLEMNTRLQVEHPVTEQVTGVDLVEWQLRVARGEKLPKTQDEITLTGHSIEVRVYAEDPADSFRPQTGTIHRWEPPTGTGIRVDHGLKSGAVVTPFYDPMVAKIITYGTDREDARRRMITALRDTVLFGVKMNTAFLLQILEHPTFAEGEARTTYLDKEDSPQAEDVDPDLSVMAVAGAALIEHAAAVISSADRGWRSTGPATVPILLEHKEDKKELHVVHRGPSYTAKLDDQSITLDVTKCDNGRISWTADGRGAHAHFHVDDDQLYLLYDGATYTLRDVTYAPPADANAFRGGAIKSPTAGRVLRVDASEGSSVKKGDVLAIVEAMKMENHIVAPRDGVVEAVHIAQDDQVDSNQLLITLADEADAEAKS